MVDTNMADLAWKAAGSLTDRTFAARHGDCINVKDFGAVGDGAHNDRPNIQAAIDYVQAGDINAFGRYAKAALYFPPGDYRCSDNPSAPVDNGILIINLGGTNRQNNICMFGDNSATTRIFYDGPLMPTLNTTLMCLWRDVYGGFFRGLHFDMTPATGGNIDAASGTANSLCFWNRGYGGSGNAGSNNLFVDLKASGATFGIGISESGANQGAENNFLFCKVDDCFKGLINLSANALDNVVIGGWIRNCRTGIVSQSGQWVNCIGVDFSGNGPHDPVLDYEADYSNQNNNPSFVCGCVSTSQDFITYANGTDYIVANYHASTAPGIFHRALTSPICCDGNYSTNGIFTGAEVGRRLYLKGNRFDNPNYLLGWDPPNPITGSNNGLKQNI